MNQYFNQQSTELFNGKFIDTDREKRCSKKKKNTSSKIIINVSDTQYPVVKFVGKKIMNWNLDYSPYENLNFDICWTDNAVKPEFLAKMQSHQKINHFPGMSVLSRKNNLGKNLMKLRKKQPEEYNFFPITFILPGDYNQLKQYHLNRKPGKVQTFIVKPEASSQGRGIYLTRNIQKLKHNDRCVVQRYLSKPFLIDGLKFDLRIYVLITGTDPLRLYVYEQGLARFATQPYMQPKSQNLDQICMHLTNYAINKQSPNFIFNESTKSMNVGHKRSLTSVYNLLTEKGYNVQQLKQKINDIFIKTFISGYPVLSSTYKSCQNNNFSNNMCFQLLGFDIIIDSKFNPILLEINYTPSFSTDTPLDSLIKKNVIKDTLNLLNINQKINADLKMRKQIETQERIMTGKRKRYTQQEKARLIQKAKQQRDKYQNAHLGGFKKIYPISKQQIKKYQTFFLHSQIIHEMFNLSQPGIQKKTDNYIKVEKVKQSHFSSEIHSKINQKFKDLQKTKKPVKDKLVLSTIDIYNNENQKKRKIKEEKIYRSASKRSGNQDQNHLFNNDNIKKFIKTEDQGKSQKQKKNKEKRYINNQQ